MLPTVFATFLIFSALPVSQIATPPERRWLAISDIHLNAFEPTSVPSPYSFDADPALFRSAVAQMKRAVPNPSLILLPGDFLMHDFAAAVRRIALVPDDAGIQTMRSIASTLQSAFPNAEFAIALGNNDIPCGDYKSGAGTRYLREVARIWAPLVNRHGAAPDFVSSFTRNGSYTLTLPIPRLRLAVVNTVLLSSRYRGNCGTGDARAGSDELAWLSKTLEATPRGFRNVVLMHIPPGYDAFSTDYVRGLIVFPFFKRRYTDAFVAALDRPGNRVAYAIAGHTHRFDFRVAGSVPVIVLGSLSPIYSSNPAFYVIRVLPTGYLRDIDVHVFDESAQAWAPYRSFDQTWHTRRVDAASLERLHAELGTLPQLRAMWGKQALGWPSQRMGVAGEWSNNWRVAWCAQILPRADFPQCAGISGRRKILPVLGSLVVGVVVIMLLTLVARRRIAAKA